MRYLMNFLDINIIHVYFSYLNKVPNKLLSVFSNSLITDFCICQKCTITWVKIIISFYKIWVAITIISLNNFPYTINDYIFDLVDLINSLELSNIILVGLSLSGLITKEAYHAQPSLVQVFILCDTVIKLVWRLCKANK